MTGEASRLIEKHVQPSSDTNREGNHDQRSRSSSLDVCATSECDGCRGTRGRNIACIGDANITSRSAEYIREICDPCWTMQVSKSRPYSKEEIILCKSEGLQFAASQLPTISVEGGTQRHVALSKPGQPP